MRGMATTATMPMMTSEVISSIVVKPLRNVLIDACMVQA
jgi:hypothetical protein